MRGSLLLLLIVALSSPAAAGSVSHWRWNKNVLRLETQGDTRTFLYDMIPVDDAARLGISPGATFWQGQRTGDRLMGIGFLYKAGCTPVSFSLVGSAKLNATGAITLSGTLPQWLGKSCKTKQPGNAKPQAFHLKLQGQPQNVQDIE